MGERFKTLAVIKLLELTLYSDCTNEDADELTTIALSILKEKS